MYADNQTYRDSTNGVGDIDIGEAIERFNQELGSNFNELDDDDLRQELSQRWSGYIA